MIHHRKRRRPLQAALALILTAALWAGTSLQGPAGIACRVLLVAGALALMAGTFWRLFGRDPGNVRQASR